MSPDRWPDYVHPNGQPWDATPRSAQDALTRVPERTGAPLESKGAEGSEPGVSVTSDAPNHEALPLSVGTGAPHRRTDDRTPPLAMTGHRLGRSSAELIAALIASVFLAVMVVLGAYGFVVLLFVQ